MQKSHVLNTRVHPDLRQAAILDARRNRLALSEWIRQAITDQLAQRGMWPPQHPLGEG